MKQLFKMAAALILCLSLSVTAFAADLGEIDKLSDTVVPEGENGKITTTVTGTTDRNGVLAIPMYKDAELSGTAVITGTMVSEPARSENGSTEYYTVQFAEKETKVEFALIWLQSGTYTLGKAKTKDSSPGGLKAVTYSLTNSAPVKVGSYALELAVPEGYEMSKIVDYDPEEDYAIYERDGYKFGHHSFGELGAGGKAKLVVNISKTGISFALMMWAITILVSAFFLYRNRDMLNQARVLQEKKKQK